MRTLNMRYIRATLLILIGMITFSAHAAPHREECVHALRPAISFIELQSVNLSQSPPAPLTVKGKLQIPVRYSRRLRCLVPRDNVPAVVILHGSAGVDSRGDFYARGLNAAGVATLEIDMWEARGVVGISNRPQLPILTYPDAFAALAFLSTHEAVDPDRIGVLGFSWGAVMSLGSAEQLYADQFGNGLQFAAHVANYPVCYGANDPSLFQPLTPIQAGTYIENLTGAPLLIQIGSEDDYDNGAQACRDLATGLTSSGPVRVNVYEGATHAWDRLQIPVIARDPFADQGSYLQTGIVPEVRITPDVEQAYLSRRRVVRFFVHNL